MIRHVDSPALQVADEERFLLHNDCFPRSMNGKPLLKGCSLVSVGRGQWGISLARCPISSKAAYELCHACPRFAGEGFCQVFDEGLHARGAVAAWRGQDMQRYRLHLPVFHHRLQRA